MKFTALDRETLEQISEFILKYRNSGGKGLGAAELFNMWAAQYNRRFQKADEVISAIDHIDGLLKIDLKDLETAVHMDRFGII